MILRGVIMKNKYERMTKLEKRELYKKYKEEKKIFVNKMEKMFILCFIGIGYGIIMFIYDFFFKKNAFSYVLDIVVFIFCLLALLKINSIKKDLLNKYALKQDINRKKEIVKQYKK